LNDYEANIISRSLFAQKQYSSQRYKAIKFINVIIKYIE